MTAAAQRGVGFWPRRFRLVLRRVWLPIVIIVLITVGVFWLDARYIETVTAWLTLIGTLALALPAIRLNEQGRQMIGIKALIVGIAEEEARLADLEPESDDYKASVADLAGRRARLARREKELGEAQGAWTPTVHVFLYVGYGLILGTAIVTVLKPIL